jgi:cysteinyl-tRNA synthetase
MRIAHQGILVGMGLLLLAALAPAPPQPKRMDLAAVRTFMYQLQDLEAGDAVKQLAQSNYDLLVVEPTFLSRDQQKFDAAAMTRQLHAGKPGRIVLGYLNIGEAESYRNYWQKDWKAPAAGRAGEPAFILTPDPDGWADNYPVAFWDPAWQKIVAGGKQSLVQQIMATGFDGLYLDWVDAYDDDVVAGEAKRQKINPAKAMVDWIAQIAKSAKQVNPQALIVPQNAVGLIDEDAGYAKAIDGIGVEDTWFSGKADTPWGKAAGGDIANRGKAEDSTAGRLAMYQKYLRAGKPVFSIDYCLKPENAQRVYAEARKAGLVPLVTQVSLSKMTTTPPP